MQYIEGTEAAGWILRTAVLLLPSLLCVWGSALSGERELRVWLWSLSLGSGGLPPGRYSGCSLFWRPTIIAKLHHQLHWDPGHQTYRQDFKFPGNSQPELAQPSCSQFPVCQPEPPVLSLLQVRHDRGLPALSPPRLPVRSSGLQQLRQIWELRGGMWVSSQSWTDWELTRLMFQCWLVSPAPVTVPGLSLTSSPAVRLTWRRSATTRSGSSVSPPVRPASPCQPPRPPSTPRPGRSTSETICPPVWRFTWTPSTSSTRSARAPGWGWPPPSSRTTPRLRWRLRWGGGGGGAVSTWGDWWCQCAGVWPGNTTTDSSSPAVLVRSTPTAPSQSAGPGGPWGRTERRTAPQSSSW